MAGGGLVEYHLPLPEDNTVDRDHGNGRWVIFESLATNLIALEDTNQTTDIFARDLQSQTTYLVSANARLDRRPQHECGLGESDAALRVKEVPCHELNGA